MVVSSDISSLFSCAYTYQKNMECINPIIMGYYFHLHIQHMPLSLPNRENKSVVKTSELRTPPNLCGQNQIYSRDSNAHLSLFIPKECLSLRSYSITCSHPGRFHSIVSSLENSAAKTDEWRIARAWTLPQGIHQRNTNYVPNIHTRTSLA